MRELVNVTAISGPALLKTFCKSATRATVPCRGKNTDKTEKPATIPHIATKINVTRILSFFDMCLAGDQTSIRRFDFSAVTAVADGTLRRWKPTRLNALANATTFSRVHSPMKQT